MADSIGAEIIRSRPCIEGFFLELLDQPVPPSSRDCKRAFRKDFLSEGEALMKSHYESIFPLERFDDLSQNAVFDHLRRIFYNDTL